MTYKLNANELNEEFLKTIKRLYKGKELEVTIEVKEDETEYLLKSKANRAQLLKSIKNVEKKKNLHVVDIRKLKDLIK